MSTYAKRQEYRLQETINAWPNWEIVKYYGSRQKNCGDVLAKCHHDCGRFKLVRIDHKSTRKKNVIRVQKKWLPGLAGHSSRLTEKEGYAIPLITMSFFRDSNLWCLGYLTFGMTSYHKAVIRSGAKSLEVGKEDMVGDVLTVNFRDYTAYIMPLEHWREEFTKYVREY
jgi:hypothetical protein